MPWCLPPTPSSSRRAAWSPWGYRYSPGCWRSTLTPERIIHRAIKHTFKVSLITLEHEDSGVKKKGGEKRILQSEWRWRLPIPVYKAAPVWRWWGFLSKVSLCCPTPHTDQPKHNIKFQLLFFNLKGIRLDWWPWNQNWSVSERCTVYGMRLTNATAYLTEMRRVNLSEVNLLLLSEPTELRFNHPLFSAERRQIEKVKPFPSVTCRRECTKITFR